MEVRRKSEGPRGDKGKNRNVYRVRIKMSKAETSGEKRERRIGRGKIEQKGLVMVCGTCELYIRYKLESCCDGGRMPERMKGNGGERERARDRDTE